MTKPNSEPLGAKFKLGKVVITPNAKDSLVENDVLAALLKHARGDWGDVCLEDRKANEDALTNDCRLLSVYQDSNDVKFWIITEADRSSTCVLLPSDY